MISLWKKSQNPHCSIPWSILCAFATLKERIQIGLEYSRRFWYRYPNEEGWDMFSKERIRNLFSYVNMSFLTNPHLDLTSSRIETDRCILVPFLTDGRVNIRELQEEFCKANKNLYVSQSLPTYEEEIAYVKKSEEKIAQGEEFENFILQKWTNKLLGCAGFRILETGELNIGIWIREDEQGKWYASEAYSVLIDWAWKNTDYTFLKHSLNPENIWSRKLAEKFGGILQDEKTELGHDVYHIPL